jgi:hypothetical protein
MLYYGKIKEIKGSKVWREKSWRIRPKLLNLSVIYFHWLLIKLKLKKQ